MDKKPEKDFVDKNFLLVSLEEKKAKKIAEVINSNTARKILDHLAKKDATESELSKDLGVPISTIHYNLQQLLEANLVVIEEFHYSSKGKEVNHYKLANKYIIIAPGNDSGKFAEALKKILPLMSITAIAGGVMTAWNFISQKTSIGAEVAQDAVVAPMQQAAASGASAKMMAFAPEAVEVSRPFMQSSYVAWFFVGALSITFIYFIYELIRKR